MDDPLLDRFRRLCETSVEHFRGRDGMEVSAPCWTILTFRDAKIVKFRPFWDRAQALEAAGLSE